MFICISCIMFLHGSARGTGRPTPVPLRRDGWRVMLRVTLSGFPPKTCPQAPMLQMCSRGHLRAGLIWPAPAHNRHAVTGKGSFKVLQFNLLLIHLILNHVYGHKVIVTYKGIILLTNMVKITHIYVLFMNYYRFFFQKTP